MHEMSKMLPTLRLIERVWAERDAALAEVADLKVSKDVVTRFARQIQADRDAALARLAAMEKQEPKGLFVDLIAAQGPEFVAEMAAIVVAPSQAQCPTCGSDRNERDELIKAEREIERLNVQSPHTPKVGDLRTDVVSPMAAWPFETEASIEARQRAEFEAWCESKGHSTTLDPSREFYWYAETDTAWAAWQAAINALTATNPSQARELSSEQLRCLEEAHCIANEEAYFSARPYLNVTMDKRMFAAAHKMGWNAAVNAKGGAL